MFFYFVPMDSGSDLTLDRKVAGGNSGGEKPDESLRHLLPFFLISSTGSAGSATE